MKNIIQFFYISKVGLCFVFLFTIVLTHASYAEETPKVPNKFKTLTGVIQWKDTASFSIKERLFSVTEETLITNEDGEELQLYQIPIPCEVDVAYTTRMDQNPLCLKLQILRHNLSKVPKNAYQRELLPQSSRLE